MAKQIIYNDKARRSIERGIDMVANTVKITMGPAGRNVVLDRSNGIPLIVNDGVTIAKEIVLEDKYENVGAQLIREVCSKTNDNAGDGTTTAAVLAQAMIKEGLRNVAAGANPIALKRGISKAVDEATKQIKEISKSIDPTDKKAIANIASISAGNDDVIGDLIASAMCAIGKDGVITVEESKGIVTELGLVDGLQFDRGFLSLYFVTDDSRQECALNNPYILLFDGKINLLTTLVPVLEKVVKSQRSLLIVADDIEGEALAALVVNKLRQVISVCAVRSPGFGNYKRAYLDDLAVITGSKVISLEAGTRLEDIQLEMLGSARQVRVTKDTTTIVSNSGDSASIKTDVAERVKALKFQLKSTTSDFDKDRLKDRIAKLTGGVAIIKVGAATETELKDRKLRLEDALNATRAAVEEGFVPGGGTALLSLVKKLEKIRDTLVGDEKTGFDIVLKSFEAPVRQIADNAGLAGEVIVERVKEQKEGFGFNATTFNYVDMVKDGIIDPAKVERCALQNAASIAGMLMTTEAVIVNIPDSTNS